MLSAGCLLTYIAALETAGCRFYNFSRDKYDICFGYPVGDGSPKLPERGKRILPADRRQQTAGRQRADSRTA